ADTPAAPAVPFGAEAPRALAQEANEIPLSRPASVAVNAAAMTSAAGLGAEAFPIGATGESAAANVSWTDVAAFRGSDCAAAGAAADETAFPAGGEASAALWGAAVRSEAAAEDGAGAAAGSDGGSRDGTSDAGDCDGAGGDGGADRGGGADGSDIGSSSRSLGMIPSSTDQFKQTALRVRWGLDDEATKCNTGAAGGVAADSFGGGSAAALNADGSARELTAHKTSERPQAADSAEPAAAGAAAAATDLSVESAAEPESPVRTALGGESLDDGGGSSVGSGWYMGTDCSFDEELESRSDCSGHFCSPPPTRERPGTAAAAGAAGSDSVVLSLPVLVPPSPGERPGRLRATAELHNSQADLVAAGAAAAAGPAVLPRGRAANAGRRDWRHEWAIPRAPRRPADPAAAVAAGGGGRAAMG
ncbi:unnamed protein product, partial [Phaeothamnion confervicola]